MCFFNEREKVVIKDPLVNVIYQVRWGKKKKRLRVTDRLKESPNGMSLRSSVGQPPEVIARILTRAAD